MTFIRPLHDLDRHRTNLEKGYFMFAWILNVQMYNTLGNRCGSYQAVNCILSFNEFDLEMACIDL